MISNPDKLLKFYLEEKGRTRNMRAIEWLRPIVETMAWDYCIVWKFGDDPSRYIEWNGCCCNGRQGVCRNVKEEIDETKQDFPDQLCRDTYNKHSLKTKACEKLAKTPFHFPLYSGVHGEVAMSGQPTWIHDTIGTQVLIPVNGGLIELYRLIQVPKDQKMMEMLMTQFNIFSTQHIVEPKIESSPNGWSENSPLVSVGSTDVSPTQSDVKPLNLLRYDISGHAKECKNTKQKTGKEHYISKNIMTERKRRNRIRDNLFALRALVPKISKMDRASIVGDAILYIQELQKNVQELQDELKELEEDNLKSHEDEVEVCEPKRANEHSPTKMHSLLSIDSGIKTMVQVEVHQIGAQEFLLKIVCGQKQGSFSRTMEIVDSLGLQVVDINVTTCNGQVLNILKVQVKGKEVATKSLKDSLLKELRVLYA